MPEDLTLTTPVTKPTITKWRFDSLTLNRSAPSVSATFLEPTTGETVTCTETGADALLTLKALNTANLSTNSLQKRVTNWAIGKGVLGAGTISGTPD